jgi:hypothetical protein
MARPGMTPAYVTNVPTPKGNRKSCQLPGSQQGYSIMPLMYSMGSTLRTGSRNSGGSVGVQFSTSCVAG